MCMHTMNRANKSSKNPLNKGFLGVRVLFMVVHGVHTGEKGEYLMLKAKKLLLEIMKRDKIIELKLEELERQKILCEVKGISYDGEKVQGSSNTSQSTMIIEYIQMKDDVEAFIQETMKLKRDVMKDIDKIENEACVQLLYMRYFEKMNFNDIADKLDLSYKRIHQVHSKALIELDKIRLN